MLEQKSNEGKTPLSSIVLIGHGDADSKKLGGDTTVEVPTRSEAFKWPRWDEAVNGKLPKGCWLRTDARVRLVGCRTRKMAKALATNVLRGDAVAYGTTKYTWAVSGKVMGWGRLGHTVGGVAFPVFDSNAPTATTEDEYHSHKWWKSFKAQN